MDARRFDRLTRRLTTPRASRRLLLAAPMAALGVTIAASNDGDAKKRCKKSRCGKDCCSPDLCFPKKVNPHNPDEFTSGCCKASKVCLDPNGNRGNDQCCYADETCNPNGGSANNGNGLCCRACGDGCCSSAQVCKHGKCKPLSTARLPRRRPA